MPPTLTKPHVNGHISTSPIALLLGNKYNNAKRSLPAHPTFVNNLDFWPLASKRNRVHRRIIVNMYAKVDEDAQNDSVLFSQSFSFKVHYDHDLWPLKSIG